MRNQKIAIATCEQWPEPSAGLKCLADALKAHGLEVTIAPWQQQPAFDDAKVVLPLAAWDYSQNPDAFLAWLARLEQQGTVVHNSPSLIRWNLDKRYLQELADWGVDTVTTIHVSDPCTKTLKAAANALEADIIVVKPACGQSGAGVQKSRVSELDRLQLPPNPTRGVIVQPFFASVENEGEISLCCINGRFAHAVRRRTAENEWRANSRYGVEIEAFTPPEHLVEQAEGLLAFLPELPLYARVDCFFRQDGQFTLSELELIEPALFLERFHSSTHQLADAVWKKQKEAISEAAPSHMLK